MIPHSTIDRRKRRPSTNQLTWSRDGERLFFGYQWIDPIREERRLEKKEEEREKKAKDADKDDDSGEEEPFDPYDVESLLDQRGLDVWHGDDPLIIPNQKKQWEKVEKDRVYLAVGHLASGKVVRLADLEVPDVRISNSSSAVLATSGLPYRRMITWDGW